MIVIVTAIICAILYLAAMGWFIGLAIKILWDADEKGYFFRPLIKWGGLFIAFMILMLLFLIALG